MSHTLLAIFAKKLIDQTERHTFYDLQGTQFTGIVPTTELYPLAPGLTQKSKTAAILYLLSEFGLARTLTLLSVHPTEVFFAEQYHAGLLARYSAFEVMPGIHLLVETMALQQRAHVLKIVASLLYCIAQVNDPTDTVSMNDPDGSFWKRLIIVDPDSAFGIRADNTTSAPNTDSYWSDMNFPNHRSYHARFFRLAFHCES